MEPQVNEMVEKIVKGVFTSLGQMGVAFRDVPSSTPTATLGHGAAGGIFTQPALEKPLISAMVLPNAGMASALPAYPNNTLYPLYGIMTGVTAGSGSEPVGVCDDPPTPGLMKLCNQTAPFGRFSRQTPVFELDTFGLSVDRGEHFDFQLLGDPFQTNGNPLVPTMPGGAGGQEAVNNNIAKALFELAVEWSRAFAQRVYLGNPTNNTAGGGYREYYGFDYLINTGYRDAETGVVCPAADSLIRSFNNLDVGSNGSTLVREMAWIYWYLVDLATRIGLMPATWGIAMRPNLFRVITEIWPCSYLSYRCYTDPNSAAVSSFDANQAIAMRDNMRKGSHLLIDGVQVPVIQDDAIQEMGVGAGQQRSQIYWVPLTVLGGTKVTYFEYINYNSPNGFMEAANMFAPPGSFFVTDNGRFAWHRKPPNNFCVQILAKMQPRLILRTPHLAARLTNVQYTPYIHERDAFTSGTYFVDGGRYQRPGGPSYYTPHA